MNNGNGIDLQLKDVLDKGIVNDEMNKGESEVRFQKIETYCVNIAYLINKMRRK